MAIRTGYMVPMGDGVGASPGDPPGSSNKMSDVFSGQVPLFIELGGKATPNLFVGGYLGFGFGGAAGQLDTACKQAAASCTAVGVRFGAEIQYHIQPAEASNPWIGYGFGFESITLSETVRGLSGSSSFGGLEFAHLMGGVDFRLSPVFGIGPFLDFSAGKYTTYHVDVPGVATQDGDVPTTATHEWLAFGVRGTFFP